MRPSQKSLTPGFVKRSLDEFKRLSNIGTCFYQFILYVLAIAEMKIPQL